MNTSTAIMASMNTLPLVHLNSSWEWLASPSANLLPDHDAIWKSLTSPESLAHLAGREEALWLRTIFELKPLDVCVRYLLHLNGAVEALHLNGVEMSPPDVLDGLDVTDYIALEDNILVLRLGSAPALSRVWLQPVPCDEV